MVTKIFLPVLMLFWLGAFAQPDTGRGVIVAPQGSGLVLPPLPNQGSSIGPSIFDDDFKQPGTIAKPEINRNFGKPEIFANPDEDRLKNLNQAHNSLGEVAVAIRKNQHFGDVRTIDSTVNIRYRDHQYPDGDIIQIFVNESVVRSGVILNNSFDGFTLTLEEGFNKIEFVALNQGTSGPNTAEFEVFDARGTLLASNRWNLATGFRATIVVIKD